MPASGQGRAWTRHAASIGRSFSIARVVKVKYRDPLTNDMWSGRCRMRKQEVGEDNKEYLV